MISKSLALTHVDYVCVACGRTETTGALGLPCPDMLCQQGSVSCMSTPLLTHRTKAFHHEHVNQQSVGLYVMTGAVMAVLSSTGAESG